MAVPRTKEIVIAIHKPGFVEKLFFFVSGILMSSPFTLLTEALSASFISINLSVFYATILSVAVVAPLIEEFAKAYPLFYRHGETERSILLLGFLTGLGFGILEFFLYVFIYSEPVLTRLPVVFFHATNTSITAYGIAVKKPVKFYLLAFALHSLINFAAINYSGQIDVFFILYMLALAISYSLSWNLYKKSVERIVE